MIGGWGCQSEALMSPSGHIRKSETTPGTSSLGGEADQIGLKADIELEYRQRECAASLISIFARSVASESSLAEGSRA